MTDPYFDRRLRDCTTTEVVGCIGLLCAFVLGVIVGLLF